MKMIIGEMIGALHPRLPSLLASSPTGEVVGSSGWCVELLLVGCNRLAHRHPKLVVPPAVVDEENDDGDETFKDRDGFKRLLLNQGTGTLILRRMKRRIEIFGDSLATLRACGESRRVKICRERMSAINWLARKRCF